MSPDFPWQRLKVKRLALLDPGRQGRSAPAPAVPPTHADSSSKAAAAQEASSPSAPNGPSAVSSPSALPQLDSYKQVRQWLYTRAGTQPFLGCFLHRRLMEAARTADYHQLRKRVEDGDAVAASAGDHFVRDAESQSPCFL